MPSWPPPWGGAAPGSPLADGHMGVKQRSCFPVGLTTPHLPLPLPVS